MRCSSGADAPFGGRCAAAEVTGTNQPGAADVARHQRSFASRQQATKGGEGGEKKL